MKKKIVALLLASSMALSLSACGGGSSADNSSKSDNTTEAKEDNKTESVSVPDTDTSDVYFKDDVLKIDMATIKITGFEVAPPNADYGEEKSTLIITYDFTNDSDDLMQPGTTWIACFAATQETDATVDNLDVAVMPGDEKYAQMNDVSYTDVKPGATVQAVISYEINDTAKPITLKATQGVGGKDLGEKVFNLQ